MPEPLFIMTFEDGGPASSAGTLIPLDLIETHVASFVAARRETDRREIELELCYPVDSGDRASVDARAADEVTITITLHDDDPTSATALVIDGWTTDVALREMVVVVLASANAALIIGGGSRPVVGRNETLAHLPPDLIASLGTPHLADTAAALFDGGDTDTPPSGLREDAPRHHADQITYWRQMQILNVMRQRVHLFAEAQAVMLRAILRQAKTESGSVESLAQLGAYLELVEAESAAAAEVTADGWSDSVGAAHDQVLAFGIASRINTGRLATRFAEHLHDLDIGRDHRTQALEQAGREEATARVMATALIERGLGVEPPPPTPTPRPSDLDDSALIAAYERQAEDTRWARRDLWSHTKSMTDQFVGEPAFGQTGDGAGIAHEGVGAIAPQISLEALRKQARADDAPDWHGRVGEALAAAQEIDIRGQLLARPRLEPQDRILLHLADQIERQLPQLVEKAAAAEKRQIDLLAELTSRGLALPSASARKGRSRSK